MEVLDLSLLDKRGDAKLRRDGYLTFDGWVARDRAIKKGAKSTCRNSRGVALFHESQTCEPFTGYDEDLEDFWGCDVTDLF